MTDDWSAEEIDDPLYADRGNFYKVEKSETKRGAAVRTVRTQIPRPYGRRD